MKQALLCIALALAASPALAQSGDPRFETLAWSPTAPLKLRTTVGGALTVIFGPGEAIRSASVEDAGAFNVTVPPQADSLLIQTMRTSTAGRLDVRTQLRDYHFEIAVGPANDVAYVVRIAGAEAQPALTESAPLATSGDTPYRLKGERALRPVKVSDDGARTYIEWGADQPLPAVFAPGVQGEEETVDSYMRSGVQMIDRVYPALVFRVGKHTAQALRGGAPFGQGG